MIELAPDAGPHDRVESTVLANLAHDLDRRTRASRNPEPRWNGYSVGKWVDDYTFVVETIRVDERTWLDNAGRPHSSEMKIEERFHRIDHDNMELTLTIDDPKMYTQPWQPLVKFRLRLQPRGFDIREMFCVPSDTAQYNNEIGDPSVAPGQVAGVPLRPTRYRDGAWINPAATYSPWSAHSPRLPPPATH